MVPFMFMSTLIFLRWGPGLSITLTEWDISKVSKIDDIALTMTFELYMDLMWEESRIIINETSPYWGGDGSFMGSTNFVPKMWLPDIQIYMCKQFRKRQIVTDVAGLIIFKNRKVLYTVSTEVGAGLEKCYKSMSSLQVIIACPMKFAAFPLDHQICKFLVRKWRLPTRRYLFYFLEFYAPLNYSLNFEFRHFWHLINELVLFINNGNFLCWFSERKSGSEKTKTLR